MLAHHYEDNDEAKAKKNEIAKEVVPLYIQRLDEQVKKNGGYLVGGKLTWADIFFAATIDGLSLTDIIENADNLKQLKDKVFALPGIKTWISKRPENNF